MLSKAEAEHRRLSILRYLKESSAYTSNSSILLDVVNQVGIASSEDQIASALHWLKEQELVTLDDHGPLLIATATARGVDVALGRAQQPGVRRPTARG